MIYKNDKFIVKWTGHETSCTGKVYEIIDFVYNKEKPDGESMVSIHAKLIEAPADYMLGVEVWFTVNERTLQDKNGEEGQRLEIIKEKGTQLSLF